MPIPVLRLGQPRFGAEPRFHQPSQSGPDPARKTRDAALEPRTRWHLGARPTEPGLELQAGPQRIPAPLGPASGPGFFPGPGWVFYSTVWLGED